MWKECQLTKSNRRHFMQYLKNEKLKEGHNHAGYTLKKKPKQMNYSKHENSIGSDQCPNKGDFISTHCAKWQFSKLMMKIYKKRKKLHYIKEQSVFHSGN